MASSSSSCSPPKAGSSASLARGASPPSRAYANSTSHSLPFGTLHAAYPATQHRSAATALVVPPLPLSQLREAQQQSPAEESGTLSTLQDTTTGGASDVMIPGVKGDVTQDTASRSRHWAGGLYRRGSEGVAVAFPQYSLRATADGGVTISPRY